MILRKIHYYSLTNLRVRNRYLYEYDINVLQKYYIIIRLNIVHIKKSLEYDLHFNPTLIYIYCCFSCLYVCEHRWGFCFLYESRLVSHVPTSMVHAWKLKLKTHLKYHTHLKYITGKTICYSILSLISPTFSSIHMAFAKVLCLVSP